MSGRPKVGTSWRKPASRVYDYNYNLGEHYYKPQLQHMENKFHGRAKSPPKAKTYAERFADDPVYGCGPRTWRPSTAQSVQPKRSSLTDDYGLRSPPGGDIYSSSIDDRGRPRFSLGDRLLDSAGVGRNLSPEPRSFKMYGRGSSPNPRQVVGGLSSPGISDDPFADPFFSLSKKLGRNDGARTADPDFMSDDPFKSRNYRGMDSVDNMMDDMKLDTENQVARFRSKLRAKRAAQEEALESGASDDFGSALAEIRADRVRSRAKAKMTDIEDDFPSISIRGKDSSNLASRLFNDLESSSSGAGIKSVRISKRTVRTNVDD